MSGLTKEKKKKLKELISQLHAGASPEEVKERFKQVLEGIGPLEIAKIEQELIEEGMPRSEVQRLCDVHLAVFREQLEKQGEEAPPGSPIHILKEEHKILLQLSEKLSNLVYRIQQAGDKGRVGEEVARLSSVVEDLMDAEKHYLREENVLFPLLEKHGIREPPTVMWTEHNNLREIKKKLQILVKDYEKLSFEDFKNRLVENTSSLAKALSSHIFKENNILFPTALKVVTEQEWVEGKRDFDEIGYCCFTPEHIMAVKAKEVEAYTSEATDSAEGLLRFEAGTLAKEEVEAIFDTLPVDITFVDKDDCVKYFSKGEERIFVRTKAIIGRKVQKCHPQKSVHIVNRIIESFKKGEKNVAEFWIELKGRLIHIRYFAVRDKSGRYLGTIEVTQDITDIKKIKGERRLLDWKD